MSIAGDGLNPIPQALKKRGSLFLLLWLALFSGQSTATLNPFPLHTAPLTSVADWRFLCVHVQAGRGTDRGQRVPLPTPPPPPTTMWWLSGDWAQGTDRN